MACRNFSLSLIQVESDKQCKVSVEYFFCMLHFQFNDSMYFVFLNFYVLLLVSI